MHRGFTLVELIIVIVVITVLTSIGIVGYTNYQERSIDAHTSGMATIIKSAAERYYVRNGEYPLASANLGGGSSGLPPASYQLASSTLAVPASSMSTGSAKFVPCYSSSCTTDTNRSVEYVYYLTKTSQATTAATTFSFTSIQGCSYSLPTSTSAEAGASSFLILKWSNAKKRWEGIKSDHGSVASNNATNCPFVTS